MGRFVSLLVLASRIPTAPGREVRTSTGFFKRLEYTKPCYTILAVPPAAFPHTAEARDETFLRSIEARIAARPGRAPTVILVDTNVIMYAAGADHRHKEPSLALLKRVACGEVEATIDAEVLQEILHRYRASGRWEDGRRVFDFTRLIFPNVVPVTAVVLDRARRVLDTDGQVMARDALHAAVVMAEGLEAVCSYDRNFDRIKGIVRTEPDT